MKDTAVIAVLLLLTSSHMLLSSRSIRACLVARFGGKMVPCGVFGRRANVLRAYRKLGPDHAERYLASFAWRYNRRFQLHTMIPRFVHSAACTQPIPYRDLIVG